jgi:hypothetical protein
MTAKTPPPLSSERSQAVVDPESPIRSHSHLSHHAGEFGAHDLCGFLERRIVDRMHRSDGIDRRHFGLSIPCIAHHNVAGQHCANLILQAESFVRQGGVASAEDDVTGVIDIDLSFQRLSHIDFGQYAKAFSLRASFVRATASSNVTGSSRLM